MTYNTSLQRTLDRATLSLLLKGAAVKRR